jgi:sulfite reductase alpha subunit-like flavoprotein
VYVQHLLEENKDELEEFTRDDQCAIYVCGSLGMGADVLKVLLNYFEQGGRSQNESK